MAIRYLVNNKIDKIKWDACIEQATNRLIYARSVYLDTLSKNWDALVLNDYEAVMPLTWNKKYTISYLYQPFYAACLGLFGNDPSKQLLADFLQQIPAHFKYWDIYLNHGNDHYLQGFNMYKRINYVLPLNQPYDTLYGQYRDNIKRNIKKCYNGQCRIVKDIPVEDIIALAVSQASDFSPIKPDDFDRLKQLYYQLRNNGEAITYGGFTRYNQLVASAAFFMYKDRAYYILVGNHPEGKNRGVSHALIDQFIRDHAGQDLLLDFEGSDVETIAFFYAGFGARQECYPGLRYNNLPGIIKLLKK